MTFYFAILQHWLLLLWRLISEILLHRAAKRRFYRHDQRCAPVKHYLPAKPRRSGGRPKPAYVLEAVLALHAADGGSHRTIAAQFNRLYAASGMTICPSTVRTWLRKYTTEMVAVQKATRNSIPRPTASNRCWGIDATGKADDSGEEHFIFGIIDHGSRLNISMVRMVEKTSATLLRQVLLAVEKYGKPRRIKTDNASVFRCKIFSGGLAAIGIKHVFSGLGKPWQNGRIERLFLTLKQKLNLLTPQDGFELDSFLGEFRFWYNQIRPHQHLHGHTPSEAWHGIDPYQRRPLQVSRYVGWGGLLTGLDLRCR